MQPAGFDDERRFPMTNSDILNMFHILLMSEQVWRKKNYRYTDE